MKITKEVVKIGGSLGVILPKKKMIKNNIKIGDEVEMEIKKVVEDGNI